MKNQFPIISIISIMFAFSISSFLFSPLTFASTSPHKAYNMMKEGRAVIIDVREAEELEAGMINGAKWLPLSKIQRENSWKEDLVNQTKGKAIFLYCRSGRRSEKVKNIFKENGIPSENIGGYEKLKNILPVNVPGTIGSF